MIKKENVSQLWQKLTFLDVDMLEVEYFRSDDKNITQF